MKKTLVFFMVNVMFFCTFIFLPINTEAATSTATLQKEVKALKSQLAKKNQEIKSLKSNVTKKDNEITALKKKVVVPVNSNFTYQSNTLNNSLISYQGKHYVRIDQLGSFLGLGTTYVTKDNTWYLGENSGGVTMSDIIEPYEGEEVWTNRGIDVAGIYYQKGYEYYINSSSQPKSVYNLQGKYSSIQGLLGFEDESYGDQFIGTISFYGDGKLLSIFNVKTGELPTSVNISVKGVKKLEVFTSVHSTDYKYGMIALVNPRIY